MILADTGDPQNLPTTKNRDKLSEIKPTGNFRFIWKPTVVFEKYIWFCFVSFISLKDCGFRKTTLNTIIFCLSGKKIYKLNKKIKKWRVEVLTSC